MEIMQPRWCAIAMALFLPLASLTLWYGGWRRRRILASWLAGCAVETDASQAKRVWRGVLLLVAVAMVCLAVGRPRVCGRLSAPAATGDVVLLVDCSRSMAAEDQVPSRFRAAVDCAAALVWQVPARRFGLVAFAGEAFAECPLTEDRDAVLRYVEQLDCETIPLPGTDLAKAFAECGRMLQGSDETARAIVLLSDGEDTGESSAALPPGSDVALLAVGIGDPKRASVIPAAHGPLLDPATGQPAASRPNFAALRDLAIRGGGSFLPMTEGPEKVVAESSEWLGKRFGDSSPSLERRAGAWELAPWLAGMALLLLLARWSVGERGGYRAAAVAAALVCVSARSGPEELFQQAEGLLVSGRASEAVVAWQLVADAPGLEANALLAAKLNLGVAHHQYGRQLMRRGGAEVRAAAQFAQAEACYMACVWDETQGERAARNLARLARDRQGKETPPQEAADGIEKPGQDAPEKTPPQGQDQRKGDAEQQGKGDGDGASGRASATDEAPELSPEEAARIAETMREHEGDFNEALRRRKARNWQTAPPKRPW